MFKSRLSAWGFSKNSRDREYQICARLNKIRKQSGKPDSLFFINGNKRSLRDLRKYIKGRKMTEDEFLALAEQHVSDEQLNEEQNVRAVTPSPDAETTEGADEFQPSPPLRAKSDTPMFDAYSLEEATHGTFSSRMKLNIPHEERFFSQNAATKTPVSHHAGLPTTPQSSHSSSNGMAYLQQPSPRRRRRSSSCQYFDQRDVDIMAYHTVYSNSLPSTYGLDNLDAFRLLNPTYSSDSDMSDYNIICPKCHELVSTHFRSLSRFNDTSGASNYIPSPSSSQSMASPRSPGTGISSGPRSLFNPSPDLPTSAPALSIPSSSKEHDHSWKFVSWCYLACIQLSHHDSNPIVSLTFS